MQQTQKKNDDPPIQEDAYKLFEQSVAANIHQLELDSVQLYKDIQAAPDKTASTIVFQTPDQDLILVKPKFANGAFGNCSVWMGAKDKKLYIRKIVLEEIVDSINKPLIENEIELTVDHANVPQIVYSVNHQAGPHPCEFGEEFDGVQTHEAWTLVSNFVNGPTLQKLTTEYVERGERLPEWAIWKCGLTLLQILYKMQVRDIVHNDIRSRNIIVSLEKAEDGSDNVDFHLIDFGIARQILGLAGNGYRDASLVTEVLLSMILSKPMTDGFKVCRKLYDEVSSASQQADWPYSQDLTDAAWDLHRFEILESRRYGIAIPIGRMRKWLARFNEGLANAPKDQSLQLTRPIEDPRALLVKNSIHLTQGGWPACCPFRKATINSETFEILNVANFDVWGQYFADRCWKST